MLANRLISLALTLRSRPDLSDSAATQLLELADCVRHLEHATVPQHLRAPSPLPLPAGVVALDTARRREQGFVAGAVR
jgi:hypothetical protein